MQPHCMLCHAELQSPYEQRDIDRVVIYRECGYNYDSCRHLIKQAFDVCPQCWADKVVPFFASLGVAPNELEDFE